jgi:hypothetical protein
MKKKNYIYTLFIIPFFVVNCKNGTFTDTNETDIDTNSIVDHDLEQKIKYQNTRDKKSIFFPDSTSSETFLRNIITIEKELDSLLQIKNNLEANLLYEDYSAKLIENLTSYNFANSTILDNYINYHPNEIPEEWKKQINQLKNLGIELVYEGEGYYSFQFKNNYFYQLFKGKVTTDLESFLQNYAEDDKVVFQIDAGIVVPWKDIRKRIIRWENFIINNPESRYNTTAKEVYAFYLRSYLLGMDNTRTYEWETREIYPEIKADFIEYIQQNPNTFGTELTKEFLDFFNYASKNYTGEKFDEQIKNHVLGILQESLNHHQH